MPFDGSGGFNRVMNWVNDALANIKIVASRHDSEDDNFAAGLSNCITKDGQTSPTANIPWNGKRLTNVANPVNPQDAMTLASFAAAAVRYDAAQALTLAQQLVAHGNLAATLSVLPKSAAYSLLQADRNKLIRVTAAMTLTLPAATVVGNDFAVSFRTMGGALTLAPNGTNQIEGVNANFVIADNSVGTLWCDGAGWWVLAPASGLVIRREYTTTAPWTKPLGGLKYIEVEGQASGGGSCGITNPGAGAHMGGGGAGAGSWGKKILYPADLPNATETVTIGAPGAAGTTAGTNGGDGGTSSFGALCTFPGGQGSTRSTAVTVVTRVDGGAQSGAPTGVDMGLPGQAGDCTILFWNAGLACVGAGALGRLGITMAQNVLIASSGAVTPNGYGSGARSPATVGSIAAKAGAVGAPAIIIVIEHY